MQSGAIKSGGKTRRAAKMIILNADHPDVEDEVELKRVAEDILRAARALRYDVDIDGKHDGFVAFQNANNSIRVTDEFMGGSWRVVIGIHCRYYGRGTKTV